MFNFKGSIKKLVPAKEDVPAFIASVAIALIVLGGYKFLGNQFITDLWILNLILLSVLLLIMMTLAGFTVMKSLFFVAAELSLLVFLAQAYCAVPNRLATGDQALKSLLAFGLLFIAVKFCRSLFKGLNKNYKKVKNEPWSKEKIMAVSTFLIFTALFIWQIFLVLNPIILNLCVYK